VPLPPFTEGGELPPGVHPVTLRDVLDRFGVGSGQRKAAGLRLERIHQVAQAAGHVARLVVFGSFVTDKPEPDDVDVFLLMEDSFDAAQLTGGPTTISGRAHSRSGACPPGRASKPR
jgi:hypothetical protein